MHKFKSRNHLICKHKHLSYIYKLLSSRRICDDITRTDPQSKIPIIPSPNSCNHLLLPLHKSSECLLLISHTFVKLLSILMQESIHPPLIRDLRILTISSFKFYCKFLLLLVLGQVYLPKRPHTQSLNQLVVLLLQVSICEISVS